MTSSDDREKANLYHTNNMWNFLQHTVDHFQVKILDLLSSSDILSSYAM